jgi:hypothetical protein
MTYFTLMRVDYPDFIYGDLVDFELRVPNLRRRAEISGVWKYGTARLNALEMPTLLRLQKKPKILPSVFSSEDGITICSRNLRDLIEALDPGQHQFLPITLLHRETPIFEDDTFIMNVHKTFDTIDEKHTKASRGAVPALGRPRELFRYLNIGLVKKNDIAVSKSLLPNINLWREKNYSIYMMSDALFETLKQRRMRFFKTQQAIEV